MYEEIRQYTDTHGVTLVAVSKTRTTEQIMALYNQGQRIFGENRVQELLDKKDKLPSDIQWHLIGHLQKNKVKYIAPFISMIHSVDSMDLLTTSSKEVGKHGRRTNVLLQFFIASEETKYGMEYEEATALLEGLKATPLPYVSICGVMGMASLTDNQEQVRREFRSLKQIFDKLKTRYFASDQAFRHISMGMSGDYRIAVEEGSTMVRIGTALFS